MVYNFFLDILYKMIESRIINKDLNLKNINSKTTKLESNITELINIVNQLKEELELKISEANEKLITVDNKITQLDIIIDNIING